MALLHSNNHLALLPVYLEIKLVQRTAGIRKERKKFLKIEQLYSFLMYNVLSDTYSLTKAGTMKKTLDVPHLKKVLA